MNSKKVFYVMVSALSILVVAILGTAYAANQMLEKQAAQLNSLKLKSQVLESEKNVLVKTKRDLGKYRELREIARTIVPQDKDQAKAVREIVKLANESGIKPSSITFPASTLGSIKAAPGVAPNPSQNSNLTQLVPVKGNPGLYVLQITITQDASSAVQYSQFIDFLGKLEQNRRTSQVSNIVLQPNSQDRNKLSFTLTVDNYIKP